MPHSDPGGQGYSSLQGKCCAGILADLDPCQSTHWPSYIDGCWNPRFGPKTRLLLIDATHPHGYN